MVLDKIESYVCTDVYRLINHLQIEAGGELIVTQLFYDVDIFFKFVKDCRSAGISVPILPGGLIL